MAEIVMPFLPQGSVFSSKWTWDDEEAAYEALTGKGECIKFTSELWNRFVDFLYQKINELEILDLSNGTDNTSSFGWIEDFATYEDTLIGYDSDGNFVNREPYNRLTARKFNSVIRNIDGNLLGTRNWKWEYDEDREGYVGRRYFIGVQDIESGSSDNADYVYGWYILELARVLNVGVDVWTNTADFSDLVGVCVSLSRHKPDLCAYPTLDLGKEISKTNSGAVLSPASTAAMEIGNVAKTLVMDGFRALPTSPLVIAFNSKSSGFDRFTSLPALPLGIGSRSKSTSFDRFTVLPTSPLTTSEASKSGSRDGLQAVPTAPLSIHEHSLGKNHALALLARTRTMKVLANIASAENALLFAAQARRMTVQSASETIKEVKLRTLPTLPIETWGASESRKLAELRPTPSRPMNAEKISESTESAVLRPTPSKSLRAQETSESGEHGILRPTPTNTLHVRDISESREHGVLRPTPPGPLYSHEKSASAEQGKLVRLPTNRLGAKSESGSRADAVLRNTPTITAGMRTKSKTLFSAALMFQGYALAYGADTSKTIHKAEIGFMTAARFRAEKLSKTKDISVLEMKNPLAFRTEESSESTYSALLAQERAYFLPQARTISKSVTEPPELRICPYIALAHENTLRSVCAAEMERYLALRLPNAEEIGKSAYFADARAFKGVLLDTAADSKSFEDGEISFVPPCRLGAKALSASAVQTEAEIKSPSRFTVKRQSLSKALAALELEAPEAEWIYPVVSETDIYVQQVYAVETDGGTIHIE